MATEISLHSASASANVWRDLLANGGYQVFADVNGNLHAIHLAAVVNGQGFAR